MSTRLSFVPFVHSLSFLPLPPKPSLQYDTLLCVQGREVRLVFAFLDYCISPWLEA